MLKDYSIKCRSLMVGDVVHLKEIPTWDPIIKHFDGVNQMVVLDKVKSSINNQDGYLVMSRWGINTYANPHDIHIEFQGPVVLKDIEEETIFGTSYVTEESLLRYAGSLESIGVEVDAMEDRTNEHTLYKVRLNEEGSVCY